MTTVFLIEPHGFGGLAHYTFCLASALRDKGIEVVVLTSNRYELKQRAAFEIMEVFELAPRRRNGVFAKIPGQAKKALSITYDTLSLRRALVRRRPDFVHFQTGGNLPFVDWLFLRGAFPLIQSLGVGLVYTAHNVLPHDSTALSRFVYRSIYKQADAIIVHAPQNLATLATVQPKHGPAHVIPHGDYQFLRGAEMTKGEARRRLKLHATDQVVLFFGAIMPYKGLDTLIKACAGLARKLPDLRLLIVGRPEQSFSPYERLIQEKGLDDRVIAVPEYVANDAIGTYFSAADLIALPYRRTYQSGVVQLAYAFGLPVVCSRVGGLADVVRDGVNGLLFEPPENAKMLADLMLRVLQDQALAYRLGVAGRATAKTRFSWETIADQTLKVYRQTVGGYQHGSKH